MPNNYITDIKLRKFIDKMKIDKNFNFNGTHGSEVTAFSFYFPSFSFSFSFSTSSSASFSSSSSSSSSFIPSSSSTIHCRPPPETRRWPTGRPFSANEDS